MKTSDTLRSWNWMAIHHARCGWAVHGHLYYTFSRRTFKVCERWALFASRIACTIASNGAEKRMHNPPRSTARDGLNNLVEFYVLTHFKRAWNFAQQHTFLEKKVNRALINHAILKIPTRPFPL